MSPGFGMQSSPERQNAERLFLEHREWVDRCVASLCRRYGVAGDEVEDVASWTRVRLIEDDYAALRKFRGESSPRTYLTVVVAALFRDYRAERWGRWRPSAAALRHGRVAVRLETLVHRDGCALAQAGEILRAAGETELSDRQLAELLATLPERVPLRPREVGADPLDLVPGAAAADAGVVAAEAGAERSRAEDALKHALTALPAEDRVILQLQFWKGLSVADVSRALNLPQKPLYRRIERLLARLRGELETAGISREQVRALLDDPVS